MTDLIAILVGLFTNVTYGIPLLLLVLITLVWLLLRYNHLPPLFRPIGPDRSWMKGPLAWVAESVAADQIGPAVAYTSYRVHLVLRERYGIDPVPTGIGRFSRRRIPPEAAPLIRAARDLDVAYHLAWLAESNLHRDLVTRWRQPTWRRRSRSIFSSVLSRLEPVLPALEAVH